MTTEAELNGNGSPRQGGTSRPLLFILLIGGVLRLVLWQAFDGLSIHDDEEDYNALAVNLVEHGVLGYTAEEPASIRPPLYPAFLASVYFVFGTENHQAVRLVQAVLSLDRKSVV